MAAEAPQLPEVGSPGTVFFHGFISSGEYVPELTGRRALDTYDRMRRSDPVIAALLRALKLPILGATYSIVPPSGSENDQTVAAFVRWNLFEGMSMSWQEHVRQLLTHLDFGFYVAEKVWEVRRDVEIETTAAPIGGEDGEETRLPEKRVVVSRRPMFVLRKLAPRLQRTIERWDLARDGGLRKVVQRIYGGEATGTADLPVEKLLVFTNDKEGADFTGKAILRPAYKPWFLKDQTERIHAIAIDRYGVGIPVMKLEGQANNDENKRKATETLEALRANEKGWVIEVEGTTSASPRA